MPMTVKEKERLAQWAKQYPAPPFPADVATQLSDLMSMFRGEFPTSTALDSEVKAAAVACVYGPRTAGLVPDPVVASLAGPTGFAGLPDDRACDVAVAHGCLLPFEGPHDWDHLWEPAWETLLVMVRSLIHHAVEWYGARVGNLNGRALKGWTFSESSECAALIRGALVRGCKCFERDEDFHVVNGEDRCDSAHSLRAWTPNEQSLRDFIWQAAILGELRMPQKRSPEVAKTNSARKGILSRIILIGGNELVAGPVLKCNRAGCKADVGLHDKCTNGHNSAAIKRITWWFWKEGDRQPWFCRRCMPESGGCDGLYFQDNAECPSCRHQEWSPVATFVWVHHHLFAHPRGQNSWVQCLQNVRFNEVELAEILDTLQGDTQVIARVLLADEKFIEDAQAALEPDVTDGHFNRLLAEAIFVARKVLYYSVATWRERRHHIHTLPARNVAVGELAYLRGFSTQEIAAFLGTNRQEVSTARRQIGQSLREAGLLDDEEG